MRYEWGGEKVTFWGEIKKKIVADSEVCYNAGKKFGMAGR